ncbi:Triose phosphate/phosphate translocator, chloroplastic [Seminavis robusta]|uniref:Triose phosphate/phosphate translocator, chloroplastic n=1 Tax=Seminavis robusta TaxID=568900 RepID=A0A9N8DNB8_9STRA|nr:Triose phosphate/phosphate translocator, chloroplastic [Seminavis robusta]|eukprot:Sro256_g100700.1 Triose phosphate/phosphate translocator, chloroplastic (478) ;mRNA; f:58513-60029
MRFVSGVPLRLFVVVACTTGLVGAATGTSTPSRSFARFGIPPNNKRMATLDHRSSKHTPATSSTLLEDVSSSRLLVEEDSDNDNEDALLVATRGGGGATATATDTAASESFLASLVERFKVGFYFALWYALNIFYNIVNKKVLNVLPAPLIVGSIQFGVGALYVALLWLLRLRAKPQLSSPQARHAVRTVGFWHCVGQLLSMVSLGAGPVSFTHIVKALEPFFSALVAALYFGKWMHPVVYATLIPVVGGVGYACLKEKSFSWLAFGTAMGSNLAFALRAVLSKIAMSSSGDLGTNLTAPNIFGLVTCAAFWISIPLALATEGVSFWQSAGTTADPETLQQVVLPSLWQTAVAEQGTFALIKAIVLSGLFHYLNNEVMYLALSNVHPVTLAVGNTMKRVFIMVASVMVFRNQISLQAGIGSAVGISGVLLYSLTKQHYEKLEKEQEAQQQQSSSNNKKRGKGKTEKKKAPKKKAGKK